MVYLFQTQRLQGKFHAAVQVLPLEAGNVLHSLYCNLMKYCNMDFRREKKEEKKKIPTIPHLNF